jgi:hypothetical protein
MKKTIYKGREQGAYFALQFRQMMEHSDWMTVDKSELDILDWLFYRQAGYTYDEIHYYRPGQTAQVKVTYDGESLEETMAAINAEEEKQHASRRSTQKIMYDPEHVNKRHFDNTTFGRSRHRW